MSRVVYLNALQALDAALRHRSMRGAADELGITAAAVGQRIRALEEFTGTRLLDRGNAGVVPTAASAGVAQALRRAFAELDQVAMRLNLDRDTQVRIACDADFLALWLRPRLAAFEMQFPAIRLAFLSPADPAPPDLTLRAGGAGALLMPDWMLPLGSSENLPRMGRGPSPLPLEGMPLLHVEPVAAARAELGWPEWLARHPLRRDGAQRGFRFGCWSDALNLATAHIGFALVPLALARGALERGDIHPMFPETPLLPARNPWMLQEHPRPRPRPHVGHFLDWLRGAVAVYLASLPPPGADGELAMETGGRSR
ncbi:LysR family transcriptional regulator [Tabrizicola oligotrophica]|uniref:LysR family transcriptional regulator n=1 Tax=Tabrizicola oligotrophica TaxID=2710650 RepID=A0A6M0QYE3_9RHOB|nr:LysR family transcriptional regulator [Tabrizicola oligotrophica]NEY91482.1 LysR family transcriptional regulator [Tabrizicola oligotrophica]